MLILSLPLFGLGSKSTSLGPGFCLCRPRQYDLISWKFDVISVFFVFSWLIVLGGWNQWMWLVSCRRQGMLTQGPAPDPKSKLIISPFLTLQHLLDCVICTRSTISIILLQTMGGWNRWGGEVGGWFIVGCGWGDRGCISSYSFCFFLVLWYFSCALVFWSFAASLLSPFISVARRWWLLCLFLCFYFIFFVSGPFN